MITWVSIIDKFLIDKSLEHLIVHNYQFSYSVNPREIHFSKGKHFDIKENVLDDYKQYRNVLRYTRAILYVKDKVEGIGDIFCVQEIREITLHVSENWACDKFESEVLPLISTLVNLDSVFVTSNKSFACYSASAPRSNIEELQKTFQFPSVGHLAFRGEAEDLIYDLHADAWADRDWMSMFFILHPSLEGHPATSFVSAIYEDDGNVKYGVSLKNIFLSFQQFYTLFWQHVVSPLYTK